MGKTDKICTKKKNYKRILQLIQLINIKIMTKLQAAGHGAKFEEHYLKQFLKTNV